MADSLGSAVYYSIMKYRKENLALLYDNFNVIELGTPDDATSRELSRADLYFAPLGYTFDETMIDRCPTLRAVATNTTGVPHIDMEHAAKREIAVFSLKDEQKFLNTITPTAEHTWGLLLALTRNLSAASRSVLKGEWDRRPFGAPQMLSRMKLGVIGYGRLGRMVARYGQSFSMGVRYFDVEPKEADPGIESTDNMKELLSWADIISLHVPANQSTNHLIDKEMLSITKVGSYLLNTSRGEIVDEAALLEALQNNHLAGAALDVLDGEFKPGFNALHHPLVKYAQTHDNLLLTPHIGGSTIDAWRETERRVIELAIEYFKNQ